MTGIDLSAALIGAARDRAHGRAAFEVCDASRWTPGNGRPFDALVSRHGVMFFEDSVAAFTNLRGLAAPRAPFVFSCFRAREENYWAAELAPVIQRFASEATAVPSPQGPFAFAAPDLIGTILDRAGFAPPRIEPLDFDFVVGQGDDPVGEALAYFRRIGPFAALLRELEPPRRDEASAMVEQIAAAHRDGDRIAFRAAAWIVSCVSA